MHKLKPDFIATARAYRRHQDRRYAACLAGKCWKRIQHRLDRLHRLYATQIKTTS